MAPIGLKCDGTCTYSISLGRGRKSGGAQSSPPSLAPMVHNETDWNITILLGFAWFLEVDISIIKLHICVLPDHRKEYSSTKCTLKPCFHSFQRKIFLHKFAQNKFDENRKIIICRTEFLALRTLETSTITCSASAIINKNFKQLKNTYIKRCFRALIEISFNEVLH